MGKHWTIGPNIESNRPSSSDQTINLGLYSLALHLGIRSHWIKLSNYDEKISTRFSNNFNQISRSLKKYLVNFTFISYRNKLGIEIIVIESLSLSAFDDRDLCISELSDSKKTHLKTLEDPLNIFLSGRPISLLLLTK